MSEYAEKVKQTWFPIEVQYCNEEKPTIVNHPDDLKNASFHVLRTRVKE